MERIPDTRFPTALLFFLKMQSSKVQLNYAFWARVFVPFWSNASIYVFIAKTMET